MPRIEMSELERQKLAKAGAESIKPSGWQPIETAPRDGTVIIGKQTGDETGDGITLMFWHKGRHVEGWAHSLGVKVKDGKQVTDNHSIIGLINIHVWMPLPNLLKGE